MRSSAEWRRDIAIASVGAERTIGAAELCDRDFSFAGDELIVAIDVPRGPGGWAYRKITTNLDSYGIASLAITVPTGAAPRVVAGLGESIPQRLPLAEVWLADEGKRDDDADSARGGGTAAEVAQLACAELFAIDDGLSTAIYRRRALAAALLLAALSCASTPSEANIFGRDDRRGITPGDGLSGVGTIVCEGTTRRPTAALVALEAPSSRADVIATVALYQCVATFNNAYDVDPRPGDDQLP